jgi:putative ABC transport system permease protein
MRASELVRLALSRLGSSRLRAALTMLGVIIGVASVVSLVAVGQGATSGITKQLEGLGTNLLTVNPGASTTGFTRGAAGSAGTLTVEDATAIGALSGVAAVEPEISSSQLVVAGSQNTTTTIMGTTGGYTTVRNFSLWQGSTLNGAAVDADLRVAVVGATTADDLGLTASSIGSTIKIAGLPFEVVGILQAKGSTGPTSQDDQILVPYTTVQDQFVPGDKVRSIGISVASADQIDTVKGEIATLLESRHGIAAGGTDDFTIADQSQLLSTVGSVSGLLTLLLAGIASISLIVGGIGIMNIMLVSVRERTREIGIRKAIGARGRDILAQFLVEALVLSVLGGVFGIILGVAVSYLIGTIAGWGFVFSPVTPVIAVLFSLVVGIVFGVWPARQAARLDPIVALRYE